MAEAQPDDESRHLTNIAMSLPFESRAPPFSFLFEHCQISYLADTLSLLSLRPSFLVTDHIVYPYPSFLCFLLLWNVSYC